MVNVAIAVVLSGLIGWTGFGLPRWPTADPAAGLVADEPGRTTLAAWASPEGGGAAIGRSVSPWLEVIGRISSAGDLALSGRFQILRDLGPLHLAFELGTAGQAAFGATLTLGPVRLDGLRRWGGIESRSWTVSIASAPGLSFRFGVVEVESCALTPTIGVCVGRSGFGLWGIAATVGAAGPGVSLGGAW